MLGLKSEILFLRVAEHKVFPDIALTRFRSPNRGFSGYHSSLLLCYTASTVLRPLDSQYFSTIDVVHALSNSVF